MRAACLISLCLLSSMAAHALAQPRTPLDEGLHAMDARASYLASRDHFSGVILIEQHHQRLYAKAFGLADRDARIPVTLTTPFSIGSQGRMFAAIAVLQLVEAGKVNLDDPVGNYVPDYPNRHIADDVTIRFLMTHWGGPGDTGILEPDAIDNRERTRAHPDLVNSRGTDPVCAPGPIEDCSNYGLTLLRDVVQRVSGQSYADYIEQHIFRAAGMTQTSFKGQPRGVAVGYTNIHDQLRAGQAALPWRGLPMSDGISTADDEIRFLTALREGQLISKQSLADAINRQMPWYGFGAGFNSPHLPHWGHSGGAAGNSQVLAYYPLADLTLVCLSNRDPPVCDEAMSELHSSLAAADGK